MKNWDSVRELLSRYYEGETTVTEEKNLREALQEADLPQDLQLEAKLLGWQQQEQAVKAPVTVQEILSKLPAEDEKPAHKLERRSSWPVVWQIAAAVSLLVLGFAAGKLTTSQPDAPLATETATELTAMRQELSSLKEMLQNGSSTSQRLQAVSVASEAPSADTELLLALIETMHFDDNVNVRMAAVEALIGYRQHPRVRQALIHSLTIQKDPNVQIMLIQGLTAMQEKEAVPYMQEMLRQADLQQVVRQQLQKSISILI
ncbi:HEAT repeat domain-containing protein [Cesiribacter sp. SM1]|uniref:HEAT repeat domain-containing protein n=1 Tax=Cesiribacter sp. SM1 TaxID=2861196 RepID=UPI001CD27074|nr:HEAT repeat domain-containing protein [Cesiribacter sp. SM1]